MRNDEVGVIARQRKTGAGGGARKRGFGTPDAQPASNHTWHPRHTGPVLCIDGCKVRERGMGFRHRTNGSRRTRRLSRSHAYTAR